MNTWRRRTGKDDKVLHTYFLYVKNWIQYWINMKDRKHKSTTVFLLRSKRHSHIRCELENLQFSSRVRSLAQLESSSSVRWSDKMLVSSNTTTDGVLYRRRMEFVNFFLFSSLLLYSCKFSPLRPPISFRVDGNFHNHGVCAPVGWEKEKMRQRAAQQQRKKCQK